MNDDFTTNLYNIKKEEILTNYVHEFVIIKKDEPYTLKDEIKNPYIVYKHTYINKFLRMKKKHELEDIIQEEEEICYAINLNEIICSLISACDLLLDVSSKGKSILFVGIGKFIDYQIIQSSLRTNSHFIVKKWLCGYLTNWNTTEQKLYKFLNSKLNKKFVFSIEGIKYMTKVPELVIIIIDQENDKFIEFVINECVQLALNTICCISSRYHYYAEFVDVFVPINTEHIKSIGFVLKKFENIIQLGRKKYLKK
uniref:ribosomal protein S2 n=1 Tax=Hydnora abyssinica TaxID=470280 RepID=UPI002113E80C|nr:ribosomal protein S2 [Hydnora abyssinica]USN93584.1 ribosomal protein S2 [Hydnora abyssinica]